MKGWLLDTNVISALIGPMGAPSVRLWATDVPEAKLWLSVVTLAEFDKGIHNLPPEDDRRAAYAAALAALEARFAERLLPLSNAIVRRWGVISGRGKRETGHSPSVVDTLLAATALEHDLTFVTRNIRDVRFSGATMLNPWEPPSP